MLWYFPNLKRTYRCIRKVVSQELSVAGVQKNMDRFAGVRSPDRDRYLKELETGGWWDRVSFRLTEAYMSRVLNDKHNMKEVVVSLHTRFLIFGNDAHLGWHKFDPIRKRFEQVLDEYTNQKLDCLVIAGDFIDLWRAEFKEVVLKYKSIFEKLRILGANGTRIIYILGNHDYEVIKHKDYFNDFPNFEIIRSGITYTLLDDTGSQYHF